MARVFRKIARILSDLRPAEGLSRPDEIPFDPFTLGELSVRCHSTWPDDPATLKAWNDLSIHLQSGTPFHSPAWQIAGWTAGRISGRVRFVTVDQGGQLFAVLPLCLSPRGALHSPGASIGDYLDPLMLPEHEAECWRAILSFILSQWDQKVDEFVLYNVRVAAPCRSILPAMAADMGLTLEETLLDQAPALSLPPTWEAFLDSLDAHERKETRRKLNKAETKGDARLVRCEAAEEFRTGLNAALSTMEQKGGEKGESISGFIRPLLESVAPALFAEGRLELHTLRILDRPACYLIQLVAPAGRMLYNLGYDPQMREWSPGVVAVAMAIRQAIERGEKTFDLLRGTEPYKHKLGGVDQPLFKLTLRKKT